MQKQSSIFLVSGHEIKAPPLEPGLYIVATPIGNLGDITIRALETLAAADMIAAEDTRVSRVLLERYGIRQKPVAYHEHNAARAGPGLLDAVAAGKSVALISDAGTPLVSDPGSRLVEAAIERGLNVISIPGASALLAALTASGLPTETFLFAGFLPSKTNARATRLADLAMVGATLVFYESPRRLAASLQAIETALGSDRDAVVARELTKRFEEIRRGSLTELARHYSEADAPKGEVVICVGPPVEAGPMAEGDTDELLMSLAKDLPAAKAAGEAAKLTGRPRAELYARLVELKAQPG